MKAAVAAVILVFKFIAISVDVEGFTAVRRLSLIPQQLHFDSYRPRSIGSRLQASDGDAGPETDDSDIEDDLDSYDFEGGFQKRLEKEGGTTGLKIKAVKRDAAGAADSIKSTVLSGLFPNVGNPDSKGLVTDTGWSATLAALAVIVILAVGAQVTQHPFEVSSNGEELGFGVR
eukprot:CAMPEP_0194267308 /NCGR_PEP_ID=MMETSP0169-20130528/1867_1 /TAXON_ID=218684 /ORGANISM="Corethron pennatum, Strain L29A3" /LENGTH=173 /DNA_ID=CAMNT_0039008129 /DNA_START=6 /DNA_END=527 /DNA_ORIENTATION=+